MTSLSALRCLSLVPLLLLVQEPDAPVGPALLLEAPGGELERRSLDGLELASLRDSGAALLRFEGLPGEPPTAPEVDLARVELLDGGAVQGRLLGGEGDLIELRLVGGSTLRLALEEVGALRLDGRRPRGWTEAVVPAEAGDRLYRRSGPGLDRIDGTLAELLPEGVSMDTDLGTKTFPWAEVAALFIEPLEEEPLRPEGESVVVDLIDGSRLRLGFQRLSATGLDARTPAGQPLRLAPAAVAEILVEGSGLSFLSELEPLEAEATAPFGDDLGMVWPVRRDRCTTGGPLAAGGRRFTRGLGVHAPSRVVYGLGGGWSALRAEVAVDDSVLPLPARGSVRFRVLADGEARWESEVLEAGEGPVRMPEVDLEGVETLVLEVESADELFVGDRANWLRPVLRR